jgi:hypothetical protein
LKSKPLLYRSMLVGRRELGMNLICVNGKEREREVDPAAKPQKASKKPTKKVVTVRSSRHLQKASDAGATLEAHQSTSSSDDVRKHTVIFTSTFSC